MIEYTHYVRHQDVADFYEVGWLISSFLERDHHGDWSIIMRWPYSGEPRTPKSLSGVGGQNRDVRLETDVVRPEGYRESGVVPGH